MTYKKKKNDVNFVFLLEEGTPTQEECINDMAKVLLLLFQAQQRGAKNGTQM